MDELFGVLPLEKNQAGDYTQYSPLVLAYIGDAVYELYVRTRLVASENIKVNTLHKLATNYVKANGQSERFQTIEALLSEDELAVFKRGRNAKSHVPKNAEMNAYKRATGLEALVGMLYLCGKKERLDQLMSILLN
ncbi:MAG: Mini-ribonuclease 3 [Hyphomonadaceae bacterium]|nr:Mini-ribonuclease 3 [Clostridia bacterium]